MPAYPLAAFRKLLLRRSRSVDGKMAADDVVLKQDSFPKKNLCPWPLTDRRQAASKFSGWGGK
jgi:hypothetical protein